MKRFHIAIVALLLGLAAVLGTLAATRTVGLGASSRQAQTAAVEKRGAQLNLLEASLRRQIARERRALPAPGRTATGSATPRVVYHRSPPIVVVRHTSHGDDSSETRVSGDD
jgi:hypothetical protein